MGEAVMKRNTVLFGAVIAALLCVLAGCVTNLKPYDPSLPPERQSTLIINGTIFVTEFNGNTVDWNAGFFGKGEDMASAVIKIPPGRHTFTVNYRNFNRMYDYYADNISVTYKEEFKAGHTYSMNAKKLSSTVNVYIEEVEK
ncbi:MAG: hypothetical protein LBQ52_09405 [Helicobacteraceae bacterium]|jgi:hypothetical protein|nr:hypothetical protein [Helicobacteraceae bacterium]